VNLDLASGQTVRVEVGPHRARFLRLDPPTQFYERLARSLNWLRDVDAPPAAPPLAESILSEGTPA